ncbi:unnamed protein product [Anisakis simplex]|uniref:Uncharacterized protein n=1 Tax=Anisakis simplex TaxID=6269 RepID=A0A0M3K2U4_ANISI|nr:unnamed protein product [Anisakis simplex]
MSTISTITIVIIIPRNVQHPEGVGYSTGVDGGAPTSSSKPPHKKTTTLTTTLRKTGSFGNLRRQCDRGAVRATDEGHIKDRSESRSYSHLPMRRNSTQKEEAEKLDTESDNEKRRENKDRSLFPSRTLPITENDDNPQEQFRPHMIIGQAEMLQKLEEAYQRELRMEERFKQKLKEYRLIEEENERLLSRIKDVENGLSKAEENYTRDKRALMEEIVELQRRLDDLTPSLADKESYIAKLENEKDLLMKKVRNATNQLNDLQSNHPRIKAKFDEQKREEVILSNLEIERREEIEKLAKNIRKLENELSENKEKERSFMEEIAAGRRSLREEQLRAKKDKALTEKALEENNALIMENSHLSAQITKLEMNIEDLLQENSVKKDNAFNSSQLNELKETEKSLRTQLSRYEEKLRSEQEKIKYLESEIEEYKKVENERRESRSRMQKELEALQTLSKSLSNENKMLRQQKMSLNEKCDEFMRKGNALTNELTTLKHEFNLVMEKNRDLMEKENTITDENSKLKREIIVLSEKNREFKDKMDVKKDESLTFKDELKSLSDKNRELQNRISEKDNEIRMYKERCETSDEQYRRLLVQFERETTLQNERAREYEQLASRVRELSASLTPELRRSSTSCRQSHIPVPLADSNSDSKVILNEIPIYFHLLALVLHQISC